MQDADQHNQRLMSELDQQERIRSKGNATTEKDRTIQAQVCTSFNLIPHRSSYDDSHMM